MLLLGLTHRWLEEFTKTFPALAATGPRRVGAICRAWLVVVSADRQKHMSAQRFGLLPEASATGPGFPVEVSGGQTGPGGHLERAW